MSVKRPRNILSGPGRPLADRWPTAFPRVGAEHWVIHGPGPLRPGPQRTWTESASWKAEGGAHQTYNRTNTRRAVRTLASLSVWRAAGQVCPRRHTQK